MSLSRETTARLAELREAVDPGAADAVAGLLREAPDHALCRVNALAFAADHGLREATAIAAFLHASRLGLFAMSWNVLCPGCAGVLAAGTTLRTVDRSRYSCTLCAGDYEPTLDEMVEVTFTVEPAVRRIAAHDPDTLPLAAYFRQAFWSSGLDLPDEAELEAVLDEIVLVSADLRAGEATTFDVMLPAQFAILFEPASHTAQFIDVQGDPVDAHREVTFVVDGDEAPRETLTLAPGPLRVHIENRGGGRALPGIWIADDLLHDFLGRRRPFLTAKRLLTHQTFRDIYRNDTLDVDQRLKITSLTFLFTDLQGSTALYERVGDLVAYDLVRAHFRILNEIIADETGAVVKTIGDAVMSTFPTPDRALAAALRMREALAELDSDLLLKIGIHEGPCLAVVLNDQQDYFGQTVNVASRVQHLAESRAIFVTDPVLGDAAATRVLEGSGLTPTAHEIALRGISDRVRVYEIP